MGEHADRDDEPNKGDWYGGLGLEGVFDELPVEERVVA
jgi:hypothetical protein